MLSQLIFATLALAVGAQKNHGKMEIECHKEHAVLGVSGKCICSTGFIMKTDGAGEKRCEPANFHLDPKCEPGHECGRECFDGKDNDGDGKKDCDDIDCQFDPLARRHCEHVNWGTKDNGFGGRECLLTSKDKDAQAELKRLENYCCPNGDCEKTPGRCSPRCSRVFVPFWQACRAKFRSHRDKEETFMKKEHLDGLDRLFPKCERMETQERRREEERRRREREGETNKGEEGVCDYSNYLATVLDCAEYVSGETKLNFGSKEFCRTKCFEQIHEFETGCGERMTDMMKEGLKSIMPYTSQCNHKINADGKVECGQGKGAHTEENQYVEEKCGKSQATICDSECARALAQTSNKCIDDDKEFDKYESVMKQCHGHNRDKQCKGISAHFTKIFQKECCGKDECANGLPNACSASCADSFLPFFSECGSTQYGADLATFGNMHQFAGRCAKASGRNINTNGGGGIPGPDASDPCDKHKECGECHGKCGWCRDEANKAQLTGANKKGWCSSKCTTTRDECGRKHHNRDEANNH